MDHLQPRPRGPCCACGLPFPPKGRFNVVMLGWRGPVPGKGWGCVICGLPSDGAVAIICDTCCASFVAGDDVIKTAVVGYALDPGRVPVSSLTERHEHDRSKHSEDD